MLAEWKESIVLSLYKGKESRSKCSSYRPITFLSVQGKVFAHVILARLDPLLQKHRRPHQSGFTHCHSTLDAILAFCLLADIHREFQQPLHVAFVDLKVAFNSIDRNALWKAMHGVSVPSVLMNLIIDLHTATSARVCLAGRLSEPFMTTSGVRQACVLAPALFCWVMDYIIYTLFRIKAAKTDNKRERKKIHTHTVQLKTPTQT